MNRSVAYQGTAAVAALALFACGADETPSTEAARQAVVTSIDGGRQSRLRLARFERADGQAIEFGESLYEVMFTATLQVDTSVIYTIADGLQIHAEEDIVRAVASQSEFGSFALAGQLPEPYRLAGAGESIEINGSVIFTKRESGWASPSVSLAESSSDAATRVAAAKSHLVALINSRRQGQVQAREAQRTEPALLQRMRDDLRNLVVAEEAYFAENARYGTIQQLGNEYFTPSRGVAVVVEVGTSGFSAVASHSGTPKTCRLATGNVAQRLGLEDGEPRCQ